MVAELDATDTVRKRYVWMGEELLRVTDNGNQYFPTIDGNKNITAYLDSSDNVVAEYTYSPFGKITASSGSMKDNFNFRFSSEYFDKESNLIYYNYRYYDPNTSRWLSRDPIGERGGNNLYIFVGNDSITKTDRLGHMASSSLRCCNDSVLSSGEECCKKSDGSEEIYKSSTQCCATDKVSYNVFEDKKMASGIYTVAGRIDPASALSADHEWIEVDSSAIGFATGGNIFYSTGEVRDDSSYMRRNPSYWDRNRSEIKLNPCDYDILGIKNCIMSEKGAKYTYVVGVRDCAWWVGEIIGLCKKGNKRQRQ